MMHALATRWWGVWAAIGACCALVVNCGEPNQDEDPAGGGTSGNGGEPSAEAGGGPLSAGSGPCPGDGCMASAGAGGGGGGGTGPAVDFVCLPGSSFCLEDQILECDEAGTNYTLLEECGAGERCVQLAASAECRKQPDAPGLDPFCEPGELSCDAQRVVSCSEEGTSWEQTGVDCAETNGVCVGGECKPLLCSPGATLCKNGNIYRCDALGITASLSEFCDPAEFFCNQREDSATCDPHVCPPGRGICEGNFLRPCRADGGALLPGGQDCGELVCHDEQCLPRICEPSEHWCERGNIVRCDGQAESRLVETCGPTRTCVIEEYALRCAPKPCTPGAATCLQNQHGNCAADGLSLASVTLDCAANDQVCLAGGLCGTSAVDTVGTNEQLAKQIDPSSSRLVYANAIDVHSDRKLVELQVTLNLPASGPLRWYVYRFNGDSYAAFYDKVTSALAGSGNFSSGELDVTLEAGGRYAFGVAVDAQAEVAVDVAPWLPFVSFGNAIGSAIRFDFWLLGGFNDQRLIAMSIKTELP